MRDTILDVITEDERAMDLSAAAHNHAVPRVLTIGLADHVGAAAASGTVTADAAGHGPSSAASQLERGRSLGSAPVYQ